MMWECLFHCCFLSISRFANCIKFNHQGFDSPFPHCLVGGLRCDNLCYHWSGAVHGKASQDLL